MRIVGLTGRIGTGKSTISRWLAEYGCTVLDSDALVRELYASDATLHAALVARFGPTVIREGQLDRAALGALVFESPSSLAALEAIVHPAVRRLRDQRVDAARASGAVGVVIEAIKLVESGGSEICDELWIAVANENVQLERLAGRGVDEAEARRRMASQGTPEAWLSGFCAESERINRPRPVIFFDNSGSEAEGRGQVERLWRGVQSASEPPARGAP